MNIPELTEAEVRAFPGAITYRDPYNVPANEGALQSRNISYLPGQASSRLGHSATSISAVGPTKALFNWLFVAVGAEVSVVIAYLPGTGVVSYNLSVPSVLTVMTQTGAYGASFAAGNQRLFAAFHNSSGIGIAGGRVYIWNVGDDPLFASPVTYVPAISQTFSGNLTAGTKRLGYLLTTRSGYTTAACPAPGPNGFNPVSFTAVGGKSATVVITPSGSWPTYAASIQIIMTTSINENQWYIVPGTITNVSGSVPATINVSISDADLAATGTDATPYLSILCSSGSTPPFFPSVVFPYSTRMGYIALDAAGVPTIYLSEPNNYQFITADQHAIYLDGEQRPITAAGMRGVCFIFTKTGTWSTEDTGDVPVTWPSPQAVDLNIGTPSAHGVSANSAVGYMWVASERGLYLFQGGVYPDKPVSFYQTDVWQRINWSGAPAAVQVIDDVKNKKVIVLAPLDGATTPNYELTWSYLEGITADTVNFSLWQITNYNPGCGGTVFNPATGQNEVWYGPSVAGPFLRQNDGSETNPYRDNGAAINASYQTGLIPGPTTPPGSSHSAVVSNFSGAHFRLTGEGSVSMSVSNEDGTQTVTPASSPLAIVKNPGKEYLTWWFLRAEQEAITLSSNAIDAHWTLSLIRAYYSPSFPQR
jgi:hypothetical protein